MGFIADEIRLPKKNNGQAKNAESGASSVTPVQLAAYLQEAATYGMNTDVAGHVAWLITACNLQIPEHHAQEFVRYTALRWNSKVISGRLRQYIDFVVKWRP